MPQGSEGEVPEVGTQVVPQRTLAAKLLPDGSKQRAAQLLNLIRPERPASSAWRTPRTDSFRRVRSCARIDSLDS